MAEARKSITVKLTETDYKRLIQFCKVDNDISHQDFCEFAILHALNNKLLPEK